MTEWVNVRSSAIRKIGYDTDTNRMYIDFEDSNPVYTYCSVPEELFCEFVSARSVGGFYHQYIKDKYDC
ncbi:MAG: KTSC domain-containing protein [Salinicola sp.]|uniref:KTSC domain-containing protein n=1 Tax=uncultured Salinicola sp. TaxID=1193542 RepID=UPI000C92FEAB|nr:KTSC domain-containing protein [uncultured Salinicola sp.]MAM58712.1 KTSC domain-containing protein [Salinicola sp.]